MTCAKSRARSIEGVAGVGINAMTAINEGFGGAQPRARRRMLCAMLLVCGSSRPAFAAEPATGAPAPLLPFLQLLGGDALAGARALAQLQAGWRDAYAALLIEAFAFVPDSTVRAGIARLLQEKTGRAFDGGLDGWYDWLWNRDVGEHPDYAEFKATLYEAIDPSFREYFAGRPRAQIRLDEIRWGGVHRDGIPPLVDPKTISAREATWLADEHIVFGVALGGEARAYPKRILAWHEMVRDTLGARVINGVYCTLCGTMIVYDPVVNGTHHVLGTSGFLYRSNKLMYDHATKSLWNTIDGAPVVGSLVGQGIVLQALHVVTTTWGEWRRRHPETRVLSLETGHSRDYREGAAYRAYFASDRLMFGVPKLDNRLANKAEVLAVRAPGARAEPLAIAADFLARQPVYHDRVGATGFVVFTTAAGANRVYADTGVRFVRWDGVGRAVDSSGRTWRVDEAGLAGPDGQARARLPAHRAFWFGWVAQYPGTRLVK